MTSADTDGLWAPLRQGSVSERIAARIVEHISSERLRPGNRLPPERELAVLLGVSRPSLREALKSLQAQGRVEVRHGTGVFVTEPAATRNLRMAVAQQEMSLGELFDMREVLELPAAEWAARCQDPDKLAGVKAAYDELQSASYEPDIAFDRLQALDAAFHLRIVEAAGNRFLSQTLGVLQQILAAGMQTTLMIPGRLQRSRRDHERILTAIMDGDATAARRSARAHIRAARHAAMQRVQEDERQRLG